MRANVKLRRQVKLRYRELALRALPKILRALRSNYFRKMFNKRVFMATLYLETSEKIEKKRRV